MDAKHLVLGGLAGAAILAGGLLLAPDGDPVIEETASDARPTTERLATADEPAAPGAGGQQTPPATAAVDPAAAGSTTGSQHAATPRTSGSGTSAPGSGQQGSGQQTAPATGARTQDPPTASILRSTARAYEQINSMRADFQQVLRNTLLGSTARSSGTLYQRSPDRFLMEFSDPEGDIIVSDGSNFWLYFPSTNPRQVLRTRRGSQGLDLQSQFIGDPVERFRATYHGRETDRGRTTHVLTLVPREPLGYEKLKVWIDAEDHLVRKFELTEGNGVVRHFTLSDLTLNPNLPDSLFEFTPPAGATVIDRG